MFSFPVDNSDDIGILDGGETVGNGYHTAALGMGKAG